MSLNSAKHRAVAAVTQNTSREILKGFSHPKSHKVSRGKAGGYQGALLLLFGEQDSLIHRPLCLHKLLILQNTAKVVLRSC